MNTLLLEQQQISGKWQVGRGRNPLARSGLSRPWGRSYKPAGGELESTKWHMSS
jgi:hypothetical protein